MGGAGRWGARPSGAREPQGPDNQLEAPEPEMGREEPLFAEDGLWGLAALKLVTSAVGSSFMLVAI